MANTYQFLREVKPENISVEIRAGELHLEITETQHRPWQVLRLTISGDDVVALARALATVKVEADTRELV